MIRTLQAVRGMNDLLPGDTPLWRRAEGVLAGVLGRYGYRQIRLPILESTDLFRRSIGEVTDIVEKEMYSFDDRNGDSLTLRPEGTAGCVRACLQHGLLHNQMQRLWYEGPMFRHERPQQGRYRQFHQMGAEAYGMAGPDIDAEMILMSAGFWRELGLNGLRLELNSLGSPAARSVYRQALVAYLQRHRNDLDADSRRRLETNPLRILDSKDPDTQALLAGAPELSGYLDTDCGRHLEGVRRVLDAAGVAYRINPRLVRGLDYYTRTVFEWITDSLGAQGTVCAGGRYDGLVAQLGGRQTPAVGFALGMERLVALLRAGPAAATAGDPHVYLVLLGSAADGAGLALAERLRAELPALSLQTNCGGGSVKAQFKRADRSGAGLALVLGEDELERAEVGVKALRVPGSEQRQVKLDGLAQFLSAELGLDRS